MTRQSSKAKEQITRKNSGMFKETTSTVPWQKPASELKKLWKAVKSKHINSEVQTLTTPEGVMTDDSQERAENYELLQICLYRWGL